MSCFGPANPSLRGREAAEAIHLSFVTEMDCHARVAWPRESGARFAMTRHSFYLLEEEQNNESITA
jgi:hypothetical protein